MINSRNDEYTVTCDECGDSETFYADDWHAFLAKMQRQGWKNVKRKYEWEHTCEECNRVTVPPDKFEAFKVPPE